ncbi:hypothetical protein LUZ60_008688 [Juncus effusus]|nr:hypothetical protein LUZ60_008688 [Juncus effusus]
MGLLSDMSGSATMADGAAITGLAIPDGPPLGTALLERVDVVASELLFPIFFMDGGYYIDLVAAKQQLNASLWLGLLVLVTFIARLVANVAAALYCEMSLKDGLLLGFIMNFRGMGGMLFLMRLVTSQPVQALVEFLESLSFTLETNNAACIYSVHLVEKQGRAASSLICHRNEKGQISTVQMDHVHNYFLNFDQQAKRNAAINVIPFTSVAPLNSMHHDICSLVLKKNISLVIVPYPKKNSIADLEASTATYNLVPLVLENAPCSVGIMVYHGTTRIMEGSHWQYHVCVLFWGGPDDRESIAIASRMACHPGVLLSVIRFLTSESPTDEKDVAANDDDNKVLDDKMIAQLEVPNAGNNRVTVSEVIVSNVNQVISMIEAIADDKYDLLIVGRRQENLSVLGDGLAKWTETPELGVLGDMLSTDISGKTHLLIVQQHIVTLK